jgi:taurine dioxygenase
MSRMGMIEAKKVAGALGAELRGVDLAASLGDPAVFAELRRLWLEHQVLLFRGQALAPAQFMAFARHFGEPVEYPMVKGLAEFPQIIEVKKLEHERNAFGAIWHSDTVYLERPPMASMLIARELPPHGGDTLFASMYAAYDALSDGLKKALAGLKAVNSSAKADVTKTREDRVRGEGTQEAKKEFVSEHPVVRTHPETGRKALYVNPAHTVRFVGWTEEESAPLLRFLYEHQVRPEFTCRFSWQPGSIALWDNRCAMHNPVNDYHGYRRVMHRITLAGDVPA